MIGAIPRIGRIAAWEATAHRLATAATVLLPVPLLYGRGLADIQLTLVAALFLAIATARREWAWTRTPWFTLALAFWIWTTLCSALEGDTHATVQSIVLVRFVFFIAALESWVLPGFAARRWLGWVMLATAAWIALESWQQFLLGANLMGYPRWSDGALTGPFLKPRAGGTFLVVFFPAVLPVVLALLNRPSWRTWVAGLLLVLASVATIVLIGQRMPTLLMLFGLGLTGLLARRFRPPLLIALAAAAGLLALTPILSPPTYAKLVVHFADQIGHFADSAYGHLFVRGMVMLQAHPLLGLGFDGFRDHCAEPAYFHGLPWLGIADDRNGGLDGCNIHPHNYYLDVATAAGIPGLALFCALILAWLRRIASTADPTRTALFVAALVAFWPIASTTSLFTLPNAGWVFLPLGWALAARKADGP